MENKIRTPLRKKSLNSQKSINDKSKTDIQLNTSQMTNKVDNADMIKVYLSEIYVLNKKIENLNNRIEEKSMSEEYQNKQNKKLEADLNSTEEKSKKEIENLSMIINDLKMKNAVLQKESEYNTIIDYYEAKIEEYQNKNISNIHMFSQCINKLMKTTAYNNKDETWRKLIKTYENKFCEMEKTIAQYESNQRKITSRQKFFEKYCYKAEKKFSQISKISKKYEKEHQQTSKLINDLAKYKDEINKQREQNEKFKEEILQLKNKKVQSNSQSHEWDEIKKMNTYNMQRLTSESLNNSKASNDSKTSNYDSKNIIMLLNNVHEFIDTSLMNSDDPISKESIDNIINDIKSYTTMLFDKIHIMNMNQCFIIDITCDLFKNLSKLDQKKISNIIDLQTIMEQMKAACSKLTNDFKP